MTRRSLWADATPSEIVKVILPVIYAGASLRLLALLRSSGDPAVREMGVALTAIAAAGSTLAPSVLDGIEDVCGDANYGRFFSQRGTVVAAGQGDAVMLRSSYRRDEAGAAVKARRRRMLGTLVVMGVIFSRDRSVAAELQVPSHLPSESEGVSARWAAYGRHWRPAPGWALRAARHRRRRPAGLSPPSRSCPRRPGAGGDRLRRRPHRARSQPARCHLAMADHGTAPAGHTQPYHHPAGLATPPAGPPRDVAAGRDHLQRARHSAAPSSDRHPGPVGSAGERPRSSRAYPHRYRGGRPTARPGRRGRDRTAA